MHGFRQLARRALALESPAHRALVEAYAQGVNDGLASLRATPWEYAILRMEPRAWEPEDCLLVTYAMTLDLQEPTGRYVRSLAAIRDALGPASLAFFAPLSTADDAALDSSSAAPAPIPPASEVDLRKAGEAPAVASAREGDPWGEARLRAAGPRSWRTTCTFISACRTSGTG
jgi:penicillin amidase